jgi:hypothetical protein
MLLDVRKKSLDDSQETKQEIRLTKDATMGRSKVPYSPVLDHIALGQFRPISAFHCSFRFEGGTAFLYDGVDGRPSTNGVFVNGIRLKPEGCELKADDNIILWMNSKSIEASDEYVSIAVSEDVEPDETLIYETRPGEIDQSIAQLRSELARLSHAQLEHRAEFVSAAERLERLVGQVAMSVGSQDAINRSQTGEIHAMIASGERVAKAAKKAAFLAIAAVGVSGLTFFASNLRDDNSFGKTLDTLLAVAEYAPVLAGSIVGVIYAVRNPGSTQEHGRNYLLFGNDPHIDRSPTPRNEEGQYSSPRPIPGISIGGGVDGEMTGELTSGMTGIESSRNYQQNGGNDENRYNPRN